MSIDYNTSNLEKLESLDSIESGLLGLEKNLSEKIGISLESIQELKKFKLEKKSELLNNAISWHLSNLKEHVDLLNISQEDKETLWKLSETNFQQLITELQSLRSGAQKEIQKLENEVLWTSNEYIASSNKKIPWISQTRLAKACNPHKPHHHIDGVLTGTYNSCYNLWKNSVELCIDTIKLPYHCYQIITWKASTDAFNNI